MSKNSDEKGHTLLPGISLWKECHSDALPGGLQKQACDLKQQGLCKGCLPASEGCGRKEDEDSHISLLIPNRLNAFKGIPSTIL